MKFEEKSAFGLLGEQLAFTVLSRDEGKHVKFNTGPDLGVNGANGVSFYNKTGRLICPDLTVRVNRRVLTDKLARKKDLVIEVKTKSCFGYFEKAHEVRTGIEIPVFNEYIKYEFEMDDDFDFWFVHVLSVWQIGGKIRGEHHDAVGGIYRASIRDLRRMARMPAGKSQRVTWSLKDGPFTLLNTMRELRDTPDTRDLVLRLGRSAMALNRGLFTVNKEASLVASLL
jgi:hypothetical protein